MSDLVPEKGRTVEIEVIDFRSTVCVLLLCIPRTGCWNAKVGSWGCELDDVRVLDDPVEACDLLTGVELAEVAEVVFADIEFRSSAHSGDVECSRGGVGGDRGVGEEVTVVAFLAGEAGGEV